MGAASDRLDSYRSLRDKHLQEVIDQRDAVLDPSRDFDHREYVARLRDTLLEHARVEEQHLYDRVDDLADTSLTTDGLRMDHEEIERRIEALEAGEPDGASLPLRVHELTALVEHHMEKEDEIVVPFLQDALNDEEFETLLNRLSGHGDADLSER